MKDFPPLNYIEASGPHDPFVALSRRREGEYEAVTENGDVYRVVGVYGRFAIDDDRKTRIWFEHFEQPVIRLESRR